MFSSEFTRIFIDIASTHIAQRGVLGFLRVVEIALLDDPKE